MVFSMRAAWISLIDTLPCGSLARLRTSRHAILPGLSEDLLTHLISTIPLIKPPPHRSASTPMWDAIAATRGLALAIPVRPFPSTTRIKSVMTAIFELSTTYFTRRMERSLVLSRRVTTSKERDQYSLLVPASDSKFPTVTGNE